ncbi:MAG: PP0621 family protein [Betaproteobacteria bacterium]
MSKLLLLILAAAVLYLLVKGFGRKASARKPEVHASTEAERMVGCAHCGVNLPEAEAIEEGGAYFCGEAHRRLGSR